MRKSRFFLNAHTIALGFVLLTMPLAARAADYESRWQGAIAEGGSAYFVPVDMASGDFDNDKRDELLIVDADGVCHLVGWDGWALTETWITSFSVGEDRVRQVAAVALVDDESLNAVLLTADGSLVVLRHEKVGFKKLCSDCISAADRNRYQILRFSPVLISSDGRQGLVAVARRKNDLYLLLLKWSKNQFNVLSAALFDPGMTPDGIIPVRSDRGPVQNFYVFGSGSGRKMQLARIVSDEEGLGVDRVWPLKIEGFSPKLIRPVDFDNNARPDFLLLGSRVSPPSPAADKKSKKTKAKEKPKDDSPQSTLTALFLQPGHSDPDESVPVTLPGAVFADTADLNGDGHIEIVFGNYDARFSVYARAARAIDVDGRRHPVNGHLTKKGRKVFADAAFIRNGHISEREKLVTLANDAGEFIFNLDTNSVTARIGEQEESALVDLPFLWYKGILYLDIAAAAPILGYSWNWDELSATLKIRTTAKGGKPSWPRTR